MITNADLSLELQQQFMGKELSAGQILFQQVGPSFCSGWSLGC